MTRLDDPQPVEFATWPTPFENEQLELIDLRFRGFGMCTDMIQENLRIETPPSRSRGAAVLVAEFVGLESFNRYEVGAENVWAFRVLDEHGLTELWAATSEQGGRPAMTSFRVRNHGWSQESPLSFLTGNSDGYSHLIATRWACLEVICDTTPAVRIMGQATVSPLHRNIH